jgi:hypothetical protein
MIAPDVYDRWRQSKHRAAAAAGIMEGMGLFEKFSKVQGDNEERARDAAAFEQPVESYTDAQGQKHYVGRHTSRVGVSNLDDRGSQGRSVTPNAVITQANKENKLLTKQIGDWPLTSGLDQNPEKLLDPSNPFGIIDPKSGKFQATEQGSTQTHVQVGDNYLPIDEYKTLQQKAARIVRNKKLIDAAMPGGSGSSGQQQPRPVQRPLTPGIPVARNAAEAHRMVANGVQRYQTPDGQVYSVGGQPQQQQGTPYNPGAEVRPAALAPSPDEE